MILPQKKKKEQDDKFGIQVVPSSEMQDYKPLEPAIHQLGQLYHMYIHTLTARNLHIKKKKKR